MTTMIPVRLECPNCGAVVTSAQLTSTNYVGMTTDLQRITMGSNPLWYLIHTCQNCGFTGDDHEFEDKVAPVVARMIEEQVRPHVRDERLGPDARWEFAARIAEWRGRGQVEIAQLYLNAAWCAQEPGAEHYYRRRAADWFEQAFEVGVGDRATTAYLIGEMYRRVGDVAVAHRWFDIAIEQTEGHPQAQRIRAIATQQKGDPKEQL